MGKIVLYIATSIDGRIADGEGKVSFLEDFTQAGEDYGYQAFLQRIGTVVMGSTTYQKMLDFSHWYEGLDHIIFSSRELPVPEGKTIRRVSGDPAALAAAWHALQQDCWLVGGAVLLNHFLERGLVDELIITVVPKILGAGQSLWQDGNAARSSWRLHAYRQWENGVLQMHYLRG